MSSRARNICALIAVIIISLFCVSPANAQRYYDDLTPEEQAQVEREHQENESTGQELELDSKVAAYEDEQARDKAESDRSFMQFLVYIGLSVGGIFVWLAMSHLWEKHEIASRKK